MVAEGDGDGTVLVVDDDESIRETIQLALKLDNHPTAVAANGVEALEWLRTHPTPRLILLDLMMPVMDGWQVVEHLKNDARLARVPVVVITAFGRDLGSVGALPVLRKPIDLDDLLRLAASYVPMGAP